MVGTQQSTTNSKVAYFDNSIQSMHTLINQNDSRLSTFESKTINPQTYQIKYIGTYENDTPRYQTARARDNETAVNSGDKLGSYEFYGFNGSAYTHGCGIKSTASETWSSTASGAYFEIYTTPMTTVISEPSLTVTGEGSVIVGQNAILPVNATDGFLYIPAITNTPTDTPTPHIGKVPICFNPVNKKIYVHDGTNWLSTATLVL